MWYQVTQNPQEFRGLTGCQRDPRVLGRHKNPSLRDKIGLGLFMGLRPMREHAITHRDACSLSSLKERGTLDISRERVFL